MNGPLPEPKQALKKIHLNRPRRYLGNVYHAIVSYLHTVFNKVPLLHLATRELCNYIYEQTPNYQFRVYGGNHCRWGLRQAQAATGQAYNCWG